MTQKTALLIIDAQVNMFDEAIAASNNTRLKTSLEPDNCAMGYWERQSGMRYRNLYQPRIHCYHDARDCATPPKIELVKMGVPWHNGRKGSMK